MSKRGYIYRYSLILKRLMDRPYSTFEELQTYLGREMDFMKMQHDSLIPAFSIRTLQRDIGEIRDLFGIEIAYSKSEKGYYIIEDEKRQTNFQRMIEAFNIFNSLNLARDLSPFIHLESRKPRGTDNLYGLLHAIRNKLQIIFTYEKFGKGETTKRKAEPYALKEFNSRWYLLARDCNDGKTKSFALDRLSELDITLMAFQFTENYDIEKEYRYSFGIIGPDGHAPEEIVLSFDPFQGKYIKTLPLHGTQEILLDNGNELQIKLRLCITHDFIMELLSYGDNLKVLEPQRLVDEIKKMHQDAFTQYLN